MGKVPAILHGDALVTEQVAVCLYLADLYPEAGLAPPIGDPQRGPYLRWTAFYGSCFEPALVDRSMQLWGQALRWATSFGMVEKTPLIGAYIERVCTRPSVVRAAAKDAELAAAQQA